MSWLMTDEKQQAVLALKMVTEQLSRVKESIYRWQWVIVGLHQALQSFMVLALRRSNSLNVWPAKYAREWMIAYERGEHREFERKKEPRLDSFLNLYRKIGSERMRWYGFSEPFKPSGTQNASVTKLNRLRNEFIHFLPKSWALEVSGLPQIVDDCLNIIEFLAFRGNVFQPLLDECDLESVPPESPIKFNHYLASQTKELIASARHAVSLLRHRCGAQPVSTTDAPLTEGKSDTEV